MKLNNSRNSKYDLADLRKMPAGPARLTRLLTLLDQDIAQYPPTTSTPDAVTAAHAAYLSAVARATQKIEQVETAEQAAKQAAAHDVETGAQAFREDKAQPKATQTKAAAGITDALVGCEAAEKPVEEAHDKLVDAVQEAWPEWRRDDVARAAQAHGDLDAALAAALAAAQVLVARCAAVLTLDGEVLARDPALKAQVDGERRPSAVSWYYETHFGSVNHGVVQAISDLAKQVAASHEFPAADWLPPSDPEHDALRDTPVDAGRYWLHRMAQRETGQTCSVCNIAPAAVPMVIEGKWWTVCKACAAANAAEQDAIMKERERQAKTIARGDPSASYSVDEDGSHHPA